VASVAFPLYAKSQDDLIRLKMMVRHSITLGNFIIFPIMAILAGSSNTLVVIVLTTKWISCIPYLKMFCIIFGLYHIQSVNFHAISAIGKSNIYLKYEIIKKTISIFLLFITIPFGINAIVYGQIVSSFIFIIVNIKPNIKYLKYSFSEQFFDIFPYIIAGITTYTFTSFFNYFNFNLFLKIFLQLSTGLSIYLITSKILNLKGYNEVVEKYIFITKKYFK
jgi:O-antigen/teichoic acid export membrane protein